MAVLGFEETLEGKALSGVVRESLEYERTFTVQVDDLATPLMTIATAPGVRLGDKHPENSAVYCKSFNVRHAGGSSTLYVVSFKYEIYREEAATYSNIPENKWSGGSSVTSTPTLTDRLGRPIVNSAGSMIADVQRDEGECTLTLVRCYASTAFSTMAQALANFTNTINNATWASGAAGTWKCQGGKWQKQVETDSAGAGSVYYECTWEFAYRPTGWNVKLLDVGTAEKINTTTGLPSKTGTGIAAILGDDSKPITEPVALDAGIAYKGAIDGINWPKIIEVDTYQPRDFTASFGTPG